MTTPSNDPGDGSAGARQWPHEPPGPVELRDRFAKPLRTVAGLHVGRDDDGAITRASSVLLDADTLDVLAHEIVRLPALPDDRVRSPLDGLPALLAVLAALPRAPDLAFIDGHGFAGPHRAGIATHFGVAADLPCIGVAGDIVSGSGPEPHQTRGAYTALRSQARGPQIGWLLRGKPGCRPLVVSPGHRVAMASAADLVMRFTTHHGQPEPTRLAEWFASRDPQA
jgi:deoxyribonuclease V